jgi:triacylglycerol esterase/lipase EstA (alpha/beta hydrolase family)
MTRWSTPIELAQGLPQVNGLFVGVAVCCACLLSGCAAINLRILPEQRTEERELRRAGVSRELPAWRVLARRGAADGERRSLVAAARAAWPGMLGGKETDALVYRAALRRLVRLGEKSDWSGPGAKGLVRSGRDVLDPAAADTIVPADQVQIGGVPQRVTQEGLGLPCVAWFRADAEFLRGEPGMPPAGMAIPVTALLTFDADGNARWRFVRTMQRDRWPVAGRERKLAADFSAPLAMTIAKGRNRVLDLVSLFRPLENLDRMGLYQLQPFDPDKTPVVFVHGLMLRPESWRVAVDQLFDDPLIRKNYQFWFFLYPTGLPIWKSAAGLRAELDRFNRELAPRISTKAQRSKLGGKVLVGHSMGGLLSSLQVREGGEALWASFSKVPLRELPVGDAARRRIEDLVVFQPRSDVSRVVFLAVPHRGSPLALRPASRFFAARVRFALPEIQTYRPSLLAKAREEVRRDLAEPANSIRFLRENSPLLAAILAAPANPRVTLHSVIGDRGRNDAPAGGDGIVPYRSAHYPGANSERIVPSDHAVHQHPEGIGEIARILREQTGQR